MGLARQHRAGQNLLLLWTERQNEQPVGITGSRTMRSFHVPSSFLVSPNPEWGKKWGRRTNSHSTRVSKQTARSHINLNNKYTVLGEKRRKGKK